MNKQTAIDENSIQTCWVVNLDINADFISPENTPSRISYCRVFLEYPTVDSLMNALDATQGSYKFFGHISDTGNMPDLRSHIQRVLTTYGVPKMPTDNFNSDFLYPIRTFVKKDHNSESESTPVSRISSVKSSFDITEIIYDDGEYITNYVNLGSITITLRAIFD